MVGASEEGTGMRISKGIRGEGGVGWNQSKGGPWRVLKGMQSF